MSNINEVIADAQRNLGHAERWIKEMKKRRPELDFESAEYLLEEGKLLLDRAPGKAYAKFSEVADEAMAIPKRFFLQRLSDRATEIRIQIRGAVELYPSFDQFGTFLAELEQIIAEVVETHPVTLFDLEKAFEARLESVLTETNQEVENLKRRGISPRSQKRIKQRGRERKTSWVR